MPEACRLLLLKLVTNYCIVKAKRRAPSRRLRLELVKLWVEGKIWSANRAVHNSRCAQGTVDFGTGNVLEIPKLFGGAEKPKEAVQELQTLLYAA